MEPQNTQGEMQPPLQTFFWMVQDIVFFGLGSFLRKKNLVNSVSRPQIQNIPLAPGIGSPIIGKNGSPAGESGYIEPYTPKPIVIKNCLRTPWIIMSIFWG